MQKKRDNKFPFSFFSLLLLSRHIHWQTIWQWYILIFSLAATIPTSHGPMWDHLICQFLWLVYQLKLLAFLASEHHLQHWDCAALVPLLKCQHVTMHFSLCLSDSHLWKKFKLFKFNRTWLSLELVNFTSYLTSGSPFVLTIHFERIRELWNVQIFLEFWTVLDR